MKSTTSIEGTAVATPRSQRRNEGRTIICEDHRLSRIVPHLRTEMEGVVEEAMCQPA